MSLDLVLTLSLVLAHFLIMESIHYCHCRRHPRGRRTPTSTGD